MGEGGIRTEKIVFLLLHPYNEKIIQIFAQGTHIVKVEYECENGCENANARIQRTESIIINNNYNAQWNINGDNSTEKY